MDGDISAEIYFKNCLAHFTGVRHQGDDIENWFPAQVTRPITFSIRACLFNPDYQDIEGKIKL